MRKLIAGLAVATVGLALAPLAHADKEGYLAYLREHNADNGQSSEWAGQAVAEGKLACADMNKGVPEATVYGELQDQGRSNALASLIVRGAHLHLCPDAPVAFDDSYMKRSGTW